MANQERRAILAKIKSSIDSHGYHVRFLTSVPAPRCAYTIGLHPTAGYELVFAGGGFYMLAEVKAVISEVVRDLGAGQNPEGLNTDVSGLGRFTLRPVDTTWPTKLLLGALDYFALERVEAYQIVPDEEHWTIDVPDMRAPWDPTDPIWRWIDVPWDLPVPQDSTATTNLEALRGYAVTEVMRWEEDYWEMFSGSGQDTPESDARVVPIATMIGFDNSLGQVMNLKIGSGVWREDVGCEWHDWGKR